jgi:hypothetical protein
LLIEAVNYLHLLPPRWYAYVVAALSGAKGTSTEDEDLQEEINRIKNEIELEALRAKNMGVTKELIHVRPHIFANGGDRDEKNANDPESSLYWDIQICKKLGIKQIYNVGRGGKISSSSELLYSYLNKKRNNVTG